MTRRPTHRPGYTLLEVLLASVIGVLLLGALYASFDITVSQTEAGRQYVEQGDLTRAVVNRMALDLTGCLGPLPPKSGGGTTTNSSSGGTTGGTSGTASSSTTAATATSGVVAAVAAGGDAIDAATAAAPSETEIAADVPFQGGVFGSDKQITLFVSRVPTDLVNPEAALMTANGGDPRPDLRRVTYYLSSNGGLCRQEQFLVTAPGVRNSVDPDLSLEASDLLAPEVTDVTFEYFDGSTWAASWTGSDLGDDEKSVQGPPRAIRMTLVMAVNGGASKRIQHVFPLRAAVGTAALLPAEETTTDPATTEGM